jgi:hypothetical protein
MWWFPGINRCIDIDGTHAPPPHTAVSATGYSPTISVSTPASCCNYSWRDSPLVLSPSIFHPVHKLAYLRAKPRYRFLCSPWLSHSLLDWSASATIFQMRFDNLLSCFSWFHAQFIIFAPEATRSSETSRFLRTTRCGNPQHPYSSGHRCKNFE